MTTAEQVLDTAAQILAEPERWHQGNWSNDDGTALCALGALQEARRRLGVSGVSADGTFTHELDTPAGNVLQDIVRERYPAFMNQSLYPDEFIYEGWGEQVSISAWNDADDRQHAEVLEAFEKARAYAAEKGL